MKTVTKIDSFEAYVSMCDFLDSLYFKYNQNQDDLGTLLGSMAINPNDGLPMDSGMKSVWQEVFLNMLQDDKAKVDSQQAYLLMLSFLKDVNKKLESDEINEMINTLELGRNSFLKEWMDSIEKMGIKYPRG
ncbi:hypothetical protein D3C87_228180 [compost metagenome]